MGDFILHPALPFVVGALLTMILPQRARRVIVLAAPFVALAQIAALWGGVTVGATYLGFDVTPLRADRLAFAFASIFAIAALITGIYGWVLWRGREATVGLVYAGAAMGVVMAGDLLTLFIAWEIKALASGLLILERRGGNSARAGMRYMFVHLAGGKLLLAGAVWHLSRTGSLAFDELGVDPATSLILVAFLIAAAVPPLHAWLPDAYPEASVVGTVLLSAYTTKSAVYALARGFPGTELLIWLGVAMALYGVVYAVLENDVRRLLGYHIISQVGYMVAAVGVGTAAAVNGATAHAFAHILYKGLLLMGVGAVIVATGRSKMSELGGLANRMRGVFALYMIGAVSISSVPLFSGFVSKELAVDATSAAGFGTAALLLKLASVGTFLHTGLKLPFGTWFGRDGAGPRSNDGAAVVVDSVPATMVVAMAVSAAINFAIGVAPGLLYGVLPFAVDYNPYTLGKVLEKTQILVFTALAAWLLIARLYASPKVSLDVDWLYRVPGRRLVDRVLAPRGERPPRPDDRAPAAVVVRAAARLEARVPAARGTKPPVHPTWLLGATLLAVGALVLALTLGATT